MVLKAIKRLITFYSILYNNTICLVSMVTVFNYNRTDNPPNFEIVLFYSYKIRPLARKATGRAWLARVLYYSYSRFLPQNGLLENYSKTISFNRIFRATPGGSAVLDIKNYLYNTTLNLPKLQ